MATDRLSKLQKWILLRCCNNLQINYRTVFEYFGKRFSRTDTHIIIMTVDGCELRDDLKEERTQRLKEYFNGEYDIKDWSNSHYHGSHCTGYQITNKPETVITNSEKAIISRSLKGLVNKGLLLSPTHKTAYRLTEAGVLKANGLVPVLIISFKDYQAQLEQLDRAARERDEKLWPGLTARVASMTESINQPKS